jgi:acyl carrier protein
MAREDIVTRVKRVLKDHGRLGTDALQLTENSDLYDSGMSSHASVEVMLSLEAEFDVEFPDAMLRREVFQTVGAIADAIEKLQG